jgi:hypothetical protein
MKPQTAQDAYNEIVAHIGKQGGPYSGWYCGVACDWDNRLFGEHQLPRRDHWWIARQCYDDESAQAEVTPPLPMFTRISKAR